MSQSYGQVSMSDEEYLLMAKIVAQENPDNQMAGLLDLEFIDQALALQRTHCLTPTHTDKGYRRKNAALSEQISNLIDHNIRERAEVGCLSKRFWLEGNTQSFKMPFK